MRKRDDENTPVNPFDRYVDGGGSAPPGYKLTRADLIRAGWTPGTSSWDAAVALHKHLGTWSDDDA